LLIFVIERNILIKKVSDLNNKYEGLNTELNKKLKAKDAAIKELTSNIEELNSIIKSKNEIIEKLPKLDEPMLQQLKEKGIDDPIKLKEDLMKHPELIPYKGSLGGRMSFFSNKDIFVLSDRWVLAYFEDGHTYGYMLLSYEITNNDDNLKIKWKVIDSYLF
jgi:hypothetical protein